MRIKKALIVYYVHNYRTLERVKKCLRTLKVRFKATKRTDLKGRMCRDADLIVIVGGDGTFLRTSHHVLDGTPIFPVSSDTRYNEAFHSKASPEDFEKKFGKIMKGEFKITKLPRLEARINGKSAGMLAVNEIFVGSRHPYHTSRYTLRVKGRSEFQKSSGVLITTEAGRTGWAKSASKKSLKIPGGGFGYVVREPYSGRLTKPKLLQGGLNAKDRLRIDSDMHAGIAVADSSGRVCRLTEGCRLEVGISKKPVSIIGF